MPRPRKPASPFRYFNSSPEVIRLVVIPLSLQNVEDLLFERGIDICHETVRHWWNRFGPMFAADIRRHRVNRMRGFRHWNWHPDEIYVKLSGKMVSSGARSITKDVLESYVTRTRDKAAALRFMKKALKRHGSLGVITTDGLRSYKAVMNELGNAEKQEIGRWANNRVENSHLPFEDASGRWVPADEVATEVRLGPRESPTTTSTRNAISSIARPTGNTAQPRWPSGRTLLPETMLATHWTYSTLRGCLRTIQVMKTMAKCAFRTGLLCRASASVKNLSHSAAFHYG